MHFTTVFSAIAALAIGAQAQLDVALYADTDCSVLSGSVTVDNNTCSTPSTSEWSSMEIYAVPRDGSLVVFSEVGCEGYEAGVSTLFVGCISNFGFEAKSIEYTPAVPAS